jgi:hypothetical protein
MNETSQGRAGIRAGMALALMAAAVRMAASSTGTATELAFAADLDGDGRMDTVLVDRATGAYRIGYQLVANLHTWVPARASGIEGVTGAGAGRLLAQDRDALVFTGPDANRVNILVGDSVLDAGEPASLFPAGIGPVAAVALDIPGNPNSALDDLAVLSGWNGTPNPGRLAQLRNTAGVLTPISDGAVAARPLSAERVQVKTGGQVLVGSLERTGNQNRFRVLRPGVEPAALVAEALGVPGDGFVQGFFGGAVHAQFLFIQRGSPGVTARRVTEPQAGQFVFAPEQVIDVGIPVGQLTVLSTTPPRLLVVAADGTTARILSWDGANAPALVQSVDAPPGEALTTAVALPGGGFQLYRGAPGSGISTRWEGFAAQGGLHVSKGGGALPGVNPRAMAANVFLFSNEPFVAPQPKLLRSLNASDWAGTVTIAGNPAQVSVSSERFGTAAQGLDNPENRALGAAPAGAAFSLANQYRPMISMMSYLPASGDQPVSVRVQPTGGFQRTAVESAFEADPATAQIRYRTSAAANWQLSDGKPIPIVSDTVIEFFAQLAGTQVKSPVQRVAYTFAQPPGGLDTDGDGVPDFVEKARGLDPAGGADTDGDGFTDKNELVVGTDPLVNKPEVVGAVPQDSQRLDEDAAYDVAVGPRPWNGPAGALGLVTTDVELALHAVGGGRLDLRKTTALGLPGVADPAVRFVSVAPSPEVPLVAVSTSSHFDIQTAGADKRIGRELVGLVVPPSTPVTPVAYVPGNGTPEEEAAKWIVAVKAAQAGSPRVLLKRDLDVYDTLGALLLERRVAELLVARGVKGVNDTNVTLFPFRAGDANRVAPTADDLDGLRAWIDDPHPGHDLQVLFGTIEQAVVPPGSAALEPLRLLTRDVFTISSKSNNAAPGQYDLPLDVLRGFLRTGQLPASYAAVTTVPPASRTAAWQAAKTLLAGLPARPTVTRELMVTGNGLGDECTVVEDVGTQQPVSLIVDGGAKFQFPEAFETLPGTRVEVFAYADSPASGCAEVVLEVISARLTALPPAPVVDVNGNLLPDDWECFFFGGVGDGNGDGDGDGFSNLQEFLDGTDPKDPLSKSQKAVKLELPPMDIAIQGNGVVVKFQFPPEYMNLFVFSLEGTDNLGEPFVTEVIAKPDGNGNYALLLPAVQKVQAFYRLAQQLKK